MRVHIPTHLSRYTDGAALVTGEGETLADLLAHLDALYPGIRFRVVNEQDRIREHIRFVVGSEGVREVDHPLGPDDEVRIIAALSGG
ncbi:MAG: MoaD/ThiS family protein [Planctomycetota bacterium]|jgi:molybdopterin converting factor small subunit